MVGTGLLIAYRLPPGSQGGRGLSVAGLHRHDWGNIHFYFAWAFITLVVLHLGLHWKWFVKVAGQGSSLKLWAGLGGGLLIIFVFLVLL